MAFTGPLRHGVAAATGRDSSHRHSPLARVRARGRQSAIPRAHGHGKDKHRSERLAACTDPDNRGVRGRTNAAAQRQTAGPRTAAGGWPGKRAHAHRAQAPRGGQLGRSRLATVPTLGGTRGMDTPRASYRRRRRPANRVRNNHHSRPPRRRRPPPPSHRGARQGCHRGGVVYFIATTKPVEAKKRDEKRRACHGFSP